MPTPDTTADVLVSTARVAKHLGVTPRQVARLVLDDKLTPVTKFEGPTGAYVFRLADVEAYAATRRADTADAAAAEAGNAAVAVLAVLAVAASSALALVTVDRLLGRGATVVGVVWLVTAFGCALVLGRMMADRDRLAAELAERDAEADALAKASHPVGRGRTDRPRIIPRVARCGHVVIASPGVRGTCHICPPH